MARLMFGLQFLVALAMVILMSTVNAWADQHLTCQVFKKVDPEGSWSQARLERLSPSVRLHILNSEAAKVTRCTRLSIGDRNVCNTYEVDKVARDSRNGVTKFYMFADQIDIQLWSSGLLVEDNGRAAVSYARCERHAGG